MRHHAEEGFTLVELLVAIVVLGIVVNVVAATLVVGLRTTDDTNQRLAESHDAQMAAVYFAADVQNADDVSLTDTGCGGAPLVRFRWNELSPAKEKMASYVVEDASGEHRLVRHFCENGTVVGKVVVAHELGTVDPTVACEPAGGCTSTPFKPSDVSISVTTESGYSFELTGSRRAS